MNSSADQKVTANHLQRDAYLYVRQSTIRQVFENTESTKRQYGLRQKAITLGWPRERVVVIDSDLGQSGASAADREGFQRLVTEVGLGRAGIVLGLEVSRLARNSTDWHRLLEICALTDTLILDEDGLYDPTHFNDRLLLGLKGTMSEAELHVLRAIFRSYYRIDNAGLTSDWKVRYFKFLSERERSLKTILEVLYHIPTKKKVTSIQFSFATKLLHTLDTSQPIYDSKVAELLGLRVKKGKDFAANINICLDVYEKLREAQRRTGRRGSPVPPCELQATRRF